MAAGQGTEPVSLSPGGPDRGADLLPGLCPLIRLSRLRRIGSALMASRLARVVCYCRKIALNSGIRCCFHFAVSEDNDRCKDEAGSIPHLMAADAATARTTSLYVLSAFRVKHSG
jgi:hypothetical protein